MNWFWDPDVPYITVGSPAHLGYLTGVAILAFTLVARRGWVLAHRELVRRVVLGFALAQIVTLYTWYALETGFDPAEALPLHLSRVTSILGVLVLARRSRRLMDIHFYFGLFAYTSFAYPQLIHPPTHILGLSYFVNHAITLLLPVFFAIAYRWRSSVSALWRAYGWFCCYFVVALIANALTGGNYFYLRQRPFFNGMPAPLYDAGALLVALALFWLGYGVARLLLRGRAQVKSVGTAA